MAFWNWSRTAATNATADPTIVWSEGQAPSSVNDSARAMMARLAEWRDDISGANSAGGGPVNYTFTSNQGFDSFAHMGNQTLAMLIQTTCGDNPTLNVDGLGSKPIHSAGGVAISAGTLVANTPYRMTYFPGSSEFVLNDFYGNPYNIPVGGLMPYLGTSAPNSSFVLPFGQALSRTVYSTLFGICSIGGVPIFGNGTGGDGTTFGVPDLRGRSIFGQDNMGGSAAGIITAAGGNFDGTVRGGTGGAQNHTLTQTELPAVAPTATFTGTPAGGFMTVTGIATGFGGAASVPAIPQSTYTPAGTISVSNLGSGNAHTILPPAMVLPYILRVI